MQSVLTVVILAAVIAYYAPVTLRCYPSTSVETVSFSLAPMDHATDVGMAGSAVKVLLSAAAELPIDCIVLMRQQAFVRHACLIHSIGMIALPGSTNITCYCQALIPHL
jgi:hypothetical protein